MISILFGLVSALSWGAGDFTGGLAARKTGAYRAVLYGEVVGLALIAIVAVITPQQIPDLLAWIYSLAAGALGTTGLLLLYRALADGKMSIAAPVSALLAAALPVVVGSISEGLARPFTFLGFVFALAAVWLISQGEDGVKDILSHLSDLRFPLIAGLGFGLYFVFMHAATRQSTYWPMVASRSAGLAVMAAFVIARRDSWTVKRDAWPVIGANGILDVSGNLFFILAGQVGRLDVASVLSALYPGATVLLAWIFLRERLSRTQWLGILSALIAIILFTL